MKEHQAGISSCGALPEAQAIAAYAAGGVPALEKHGGAAARLLLEELR